MRNIVRYFSFGDQKLFYFLNGGIKCRIFDRFMPYITNLGGAIFTTFLPLLLIIVGKNKARFIGLEILVSLSIGQLFVQLLKRTLTRERPYNNLQNINTFGIELKDYSFPSGHTTASFSIATIISLNLPQIMLMVFFLAFIIGISRIYLAVHYPSDVLVGIILGTGASFVTHGYFLNNFVI